MEHPALDSASVSSASSSDDDVEACPQTVAMGQQRGGWEKFDDEPSCSSAGRPPLPPPRSELEKLYSTSSHLVQDSVELATQNPVSTNPFRATEAEVVSRPKSPFEDFSTCIAEALLNNSEQTDDPTSASALATTGKQLFEKAQEESCISVSVDSQNSSNLTPFMPSATSLSVNDSSTVSRSVTSLPGPVTGAPVSIGSATSDISTNLLRTNLNPANPRHRSNSMNRHNYASILRPIPQEGTFSPETIARKTNPFYSGNINSGHYPQLTPLSQKPQGPRSPSYVQNFPLPGATTINSHKRPGQPPPKPQPYSGEFQQTSHGESSNSGNGSDVVLRSRHSSSAFLAQRLPSLGEFDPFGDFGEAGYVFQNANTSPL